MQLYETVLVRHGLMIIGAAASGKSVVRATLCAALEAGLEPSLRGAFCGGELVLRAAEPARQGLRYDLHEGVLDERRDEVPVLEKGCSFGNPYAFRHRITFESRCVLTLKKKKMTLDCF